MQDDNIEKDFLKRVINLDLSLFRYDSFMGLGFESVLIGVISGILFGFLIGIYPFFTSALPFLPTTNLFLFVAFGIPLTGSTHYDPRLGVLSSTVLLVTARATQILFGLAPPTQEFLLLAGIWSIAQIFLIGYLPGKLIPTSENLRYLFKGLAKITLLYILGEQIVWALANGSLIPTKAILTFPVYSIPLLFVVSAFTAFFFTNTFCPYMMMPLISTAMNGQRQCGTKNFVFKLDSPITVNDAKIKEASKRGFRLVSELPSVTVFSCPRGGMISIYHSGEILIRKVKKGSAEKMNHHLTAIFAD